MEANTRTIRPDRRAGTLSDIQRTQHPALLSAWFSSRTWSGPVTLGQGAMAALVERAHNRRLPVTTSQQAAIRTCRCALQQLRSSRSITDAAILEVNQRLAQALLALHDAADQVVGIAELDGAVGATGSRHVESLRVASRNQSAVSLTGDALTLQGDSTHDYRLGCLRSLVACRAAKGVAAMRAEFVPDGGKAQGATLLIPALDDLIEIYADARTASGPLSTGEQERLATWKALRVAEHEKRRKRNENELVDVIAGLYEVGVDLLHQWVDPSQPLHGILVTSSAPPTACPPGWVAGMEFVSD